MLVLAYGHATIYERDGAFQLYVDYMRPFGAGAAQMAFDALYKKLEAEGLFAPERKRPLPKMPRCIGVVTSKTGAAWQDVQNVVGRRWPLVRLLLAPVVVQGVEAERSIVAGIRALDRDTSAGFDSGHTGWRQQGRFVDLQQRAHCTCSGGLP